MNRLPRILLTILLNSLALRTVPLPAQEAALADTLTGVSADGARWILEMPPAWNGTLLVWSHGWSPALRDPESAAPGTRERLLTEGYALAASSYSAAGWALAEAVPDQLGLMAEFRSRFGEPDRVLAWGNSMGGLVSTALAERYPDAVDGVLTMCASSGGAVGMLNTGLDGAFAFVTLVAPDDGIRLVHVDDDRQNGARVAAALERARATSAGRARVALAAVLGGLPGWTQRDEARPADDDYETQAAQMADAFAMGVFLPRAEQEARAGGAVSWNSGVDYRVQLARSGRRALVEHMYALAGLDLEADLERLNAAPRVALERESAQYMLHNFTPGGRIDVPVLTLHPVGDGVTTPSMAAGFRAIVEDAGRGDLVASAWNERAGHCTSSPAEMIAALHALEGRIDDGVWSVSPAVLNAGARAIDPAAEPTFIDFTPAPLLRQCADRIGACPGLR